MTSSSSADRESIVERDSRATVMIVAHAWYDDLFGGAFRVATELARGLVRAGWRVVYVCWNAADSLDREMIDGVEVRRYRLLGSSLPVPRFWQHVRRAQELIAQISRELDIVAVSGHSPLQYLGALLALKSNVSIRRSYIVHSPFADEQQASYGLLPVTWMSKLRSAIAAMIDGWCLRGSTLSQVLSRYTAQLLAKRYGEDIRNRCIVCPGWVDTERFQPAKDRQLLRKNLPAEWHTDEPLLFTVRRLEGRMGLDTLISAVAQIPSQQRFRVLIAGTGPLREELLDAIKAHQLEDRVFLLGRISEELLPTCYAASDVFVLPSRSMECFGLIVLESFATATPVIGARTGAIPELIAELGDQWMFEAGSAESLADQISLFLRGELALASNPRSIALRYDISRIMPRWIEHCLGAEAQVGTFQAHHMTIVN